MKLWEKLTSDDVNVVAEGLDKYLKSQENAGHKQFAKVAENYYKGQHDIRHSRIFFVDEHQNVVEDALSANIKIPHQFFTELVDQKVQHLLSEAIEFKTEIEPLGKRLEEYIDEDFNLFLDEIVEGASVKGIEFGYARTTARDTLKFETSDYLQTDTITDDLNDEVAVVRTYTQVVDNDGKDIEVVYGEVHRENDVVYCIKLPRKRFEPDATRTLNPQPHVVARDLDDDEKIYQRSYGRIPFYRLSNNRNESSDLIPVKALIDDYDTMASFLSNDLQDFGRPIYVVKGYQGSDRNEIKQRIQSGVVFAGAPNTPGELEVRSFNVPYEARRAKLDIDREAIYKFGMGFDSSKNDGSNITNVVIQARYSLLNMKCNKMEPRLRGLVRWCLELILEDIQTKHGETYNVNDIDIHIKRTTLTNDNDEAQRLLAEAQTKMTLVQALATSAPYLDDETVIKQMCEIYEIDYEEVIAVMEAEDIGTLEGEDDNEQVAT